jgi:hypothetical protein
MAGIIVMTQKIEPRKRRVQPQEGCLHLFCCHSRKGVLITTAPYPAEERITWQPVAGLSQARQGRNVGPGRTPSSSSIGPTPHLSRTEEGVYALLQHLTFQPVICMIDACRRPCKNSVDGKGVRIGKGGKGGRGGREGEGRRGERGGGREGEEGGGRIKRSGFLGRASGIRVDSCSKSCSECGPMNDSHSR